MMIMSKDAISRKALIERINQAEENFKSDYIESISSGGDPFVDGVLSGVFNIRQMVAQAPSIAKALEQESKTDTWSIKEVADTLKKHGLIREQEPCEDAISRQALYEWIDGWKEKNKYYHPHTKNEIIPICEVIDIIQSLPSVTPKPKIGHWKSVEPGLFDSVSIRWECSECKKSDRFRSNFCFNCGAKMEGEVQDADSN